MNINENIKRLLKLKNKQQKQMSESIGVSTSTLNNWLKLGRSIPYEYIIPICEFLDVSPYSLLGVDTIKEMPLNDEHKLLITLYDKLDERGKGKVAGVIETLAELAAERTVKERAAKQEKSAFSAAEKATKERASEQAKRTAKPVELTVDEQPALNKPEQTNREKHTIAILRLSRKCWNGLVFG